MKLRNLFSKLAIAVLSLSIMSSVAASAEEAVTEDAAEEKSYEIAYEEEGLFFEYFDMLTPTNEYVAVSGSSDYGAHFMSANVKVTDEEGICIDGDEPSIAFKGNADVRWWALSADWSGWAIIPSADFVFEYYINIQNISNSVTVCLTEVTANDPSMENNTCNESNGGLFMHIVPSEATEGAYDILNRDTTVITTITGKEDHKISVVFLEGTDEYCFFIDDVYVPNSTSKFVCPITQIDAFRFDSFSIEENPNEFAIDCITMDSCTLVEEGEEKPTDEPTDEPTDAPTVEPTKAPEADADADKDTDTDNDNDVEGEDEANGGCGSAIGGGAAMMALLGFAVVSMKKRK